MKMGNVSTGFSVSLDGFIAGPNDEVDRLFAWMFAGNTDVQLKTGDHDIDLKVSEESAEVFEEATHSIGALIAGRRIFDVAGAWGGKHPLNVPIVVLTHNPPQEWLSRADSPFTFVTTGIEDAIKKAKEIAGDKTAAIASANVLQQALKLGLVDEIHFDLVPVLLGEGISMFGTLGIKPVDLKITKVVPAPNVTHITYSVVK
jgi:dihydrofolate reductase